MGNTEQSMITSDTLLISRDGESFKMVRHIEETLSEKELNKRKIEIELEKKKLESEKDKALAFFTQCSNGIVECNKKLKALDDALEKGQGKM